MDGPSHRKLHRRDVEVLCLVHDLKDQVRQLDLVALGSMGAMLFQHLLSQQPNQKIKTLEWHQSTAPHLGTSAFMSMGLVPFCSTEDGEIYMRVEIGILSLWK
jgi:hypothetical protein